MRIKRFDSHVIAYFKHEKYLSDLRFLCALNGPPFKPLKMNIPLCKGF